MAEEFQLVLPGQWRERVEKWLESQGCYLAGPVPFLDDDLPTFILGIPEPHVAHPGVPAPKKDPQPIHEPTDHCAGYCRATGSTCSEDPEAHDQWNDRSQW